MTSEFCVGQMFLQGALEEVGHFFAFFLYEPQIGNLSDIPPTTGLCHILTQLEGLGSAPGKISNLAATLDFLLMVQICRGNIKHLVQRQNGLLERIFIFSIA